MKSIHTMQLLVVTSVQFAMDNATDESCWGKELKISIFCWSLQLFNCEFKWLFNSKMKWPVALSEEFFTRGGYQFKICVTWARSRIQPWSHVFFCPSRQKMEENWIAHWIEPFNCDSTLSKHAKAYSAHPLNPYPQRLKKFSTAVHFSITFPLLFHLPPALTFTLILLDST